jgi:ComF family protein
LLCGVAGPHDGICNACYRDLPGLASARCPVCANLSTDSQRCGECIAHAPSFSRTSVAVSYRFPVDPLVLRLKYGPDLTVVEPLAALLAERVRTERPPDLVLAMPMAPPRLRERGFNQALELARALCSRLGLKLAPEVCRRTRHGPPQTALPWDERRRNIRGAFQCERNLAGARVAVVDDVLTTGATLNELAGVLLRAGATEVVGWVVARTEKE